MNEQLILNFPPNKIYLKEDFYVSISNIEAYSINESWPRWIKKTVNIFGPAGSGKSHLVSILEKNASCMKISCRDLSEKIFLQFKLKEVLIIEDLIEKISENILYSLFNVATQENKFLLITSKKELNLYNFKLTDLKSRAKSCLNVEIKLPSDDLINVILSKNFSDRQITVDKKHIDYIIKRIDRSYDKISKFISILDNQSLKKGKPFNLKIIKESLKMLNV